MVTHPNWHAFWGAHWVLCSLSTATRLDAGRVVCELPPLFAQVTDDTPLSSNAAYVSLTLSKSLYDISKYNGYVVLRGFASSPAFSAFHMFNSLN